MAFNTTDFLQSGAIMSLPEQKLLMGWGKKQQGTNGQKPAFYLTDFFLETKQPWIQYTHTVEMTWDDFEEYLAEVDSLPRCEWMIDSSSNFHYAFNQLLDLLKSGQLEKAVPYVFTRSSTQMTAERLRACLSKGLASVKKGNGYLYGCWDQTSGVLGVTPELLFSHGSHQPQRLHTMALAGTCSRDCSHEEFMKSAKDQHEHYVVVQGICQALQKLGVVHVGALQILPLSKLAHLMTPIEIDLMEAFDFDQLVRELHPTPALGAFPRQEGWVWLEHYQQQVPRGYYGAPIGYCDPQSGLSQCFVGIRNIQWNENGMRIGAGGGVVKESTLEQEWQEIQLKMKAIRALFDL